MKLDLFLLLCLSGIVPVTHSILQPPHYLYLIKKAVTWPEAQKSCRMMYTDLARVKDSSVLLKISEMAASNGITTWPIWIGLYNDINSWRWSFNNLLLTSTAVTFWDSGQPDNYNGCEACGAIFSPGNWEDSNCSTLKPFICYDARNSGADRFVGVGSPQMNWSDAQTNCRTFHTDLASALDQMDNDLLGQVASVQGTSWFGLYRDTWKWLNNTVASNIQWAPGQPNNYYPQENCGVLWKSLLNDENCGTQHYFFCEFIPQVRQIMKLQVKSDGNVFDPAVQASILELMKEKLEEHGMLVNTTVTWRVQQPDRNVFYKKDKS